MRFHGLVLHPLRIAHMDSFHDLLLELRRKGNVDHLLLGVRRDIDIFRIKKQRWAMSFCVFLQTTLISAMRIILWLFEDWDAFDTQLNMSKHQRKNDTRENMC